MLWGIRPEPPCPKAPAMDRPHRKPGTPYAPGTSRSPGSDAPGADPEPQDDARKPDNRRHDQTYKGIFGHDEAVRSLIRDFLAVEWHHVLDLAAITFIRTEVIARQMRRRLSDLAVQVRFKDRKDSVVFLVEFQSSHDPGMALRTSDCVLAMIGALHANSNMLDSGGTVSRVVPYVLYTGARPWTAATSLADLTRTPEPPPAAARALAGLGTRRYALLDLQSASAQDLLPKDSVLGWLGALEREPWKGFLRVHASVAKQWAGEERRSLRESFAEWTDERMRAAGVPEDARRVVRERIIQPEEEAEMGQTYQEWAEGHRRRGLEEGEERGEARGEARGRVRGREEQGRVMVLRQASRKFGAETAKRLEELVRTMGPEQLVLLADAVMDCDTGDALLAKAANGVCVAP